jgi:hypothetical protein
MQNLARLAIFAALAVLLSHPPALAAGEDGQRRLALVIGNNAYENVPKLVKAVNDAEAVASRLQQIGFEVTVARDIGRRAMSRAVLEFEKRVKPGDLALFYYAGHGFAISGRNYLLPVDVAEAGQGEEALVADESFLADELTERLQAAGAKTVVLVLDACRDNPFKVPGKRSLGGEAGLARMSPAEGVFVLFSAGIGQSALDRMDDNDTDPNSVFTRTFLSELSRPNATILDIAKATQVGVRDLAARIGHLQTPAYYDQIIGTVTLNPNAGLLARGAVQGFNEGQSVAMLPRIDPAPKAGKGKPSANFSYSNSGWIVSVSLPEAAVQFGYRIGEAGDFVDTGLTQNIDPRTGQAMPVTWFSLPADQPAGTVYVTWRDKRGEEAGVFPIAFDPGQALKAGQKQILEQLWTAWVSFRQFNGELVYFSHLMSYRCGIEKIEYTFDNSDKVETWPLHQCDPADPIRIPDNAKLYRQMPKGTKSMQVVVTYFDGAKSPVRNFNVKF